MQDNISNRMTSPRGRGRPRKEEVAERESFQPAESIEAELPALPPISGIRCLCCGRGMVPRIIRTDGHKRDIKCSLCDGRMKAIYDPSGKKPPLIQRL